MVVGGIVVVVVVGGVVVVVGVAAGLTTTVRSRTASGATPFCAETVNVKEPAVVGLPASSPAGVRVRPGGSKPAVSA